MTTPKQPSLHWYGDTIGQGDRRAHVTVTRGNAIIYIAFSEALYALDWFDVESRTRIMVTAEVCARHGLLHPDDLEEYTAWVQS